MVLPLSLNRMDRFYLHMDRWKGPISIAVQVNEEQVEELFSIISAIKRNNIRFTFYIVKISNESNYRCTFKSLNGTDVYYESCYTINVLRNLAIETIKTSHFMIIDGDGIISGSVLNRSLILVTLENNIKNYISLISNEKEVLVFPLFPYQSPYHHQCKRKGNCALAFVITYGFHYSDGNTFLEQKKN